MRELLPPLRRSPSLEEGGLWRGELQRLVASLQRLDAFATDGCIAVPRRGAHCAPVRPRRYNNNPSRGRAKILIQLRVQGRNPARFKGGYGVPRGFKGEKSKSPPNPLGLAERVHRPQTMIPPRSPTPHSSCEFGFFFICFICPKHMMFVSKTIRCPSGECRNHRHVFFIESTYFEIRKRMKFQKNAVL